MGATYQVPTTTTMVYSPEEVLRKIVFVQYLKRKTIICYDVANNVLTLMTGTKLEKPVLEPEPLF